MRVWLHADFFSQATGHCDWQPYQSHMIKEEEEEFAKKKGAWKRGAGQLS